MTAVDEKISCLLAAAVEELGCTNMCVAIHGLDVRVDAKWERDANVVGTLHVRVPPARPDHGSLSVFEKFFELPDGEYVGVA